MKNVIVIAPHPDDETLGCGGTLLKHKNNGDKVYCIFVTGIFENQGFSKDKIEERQKEIEKVSSMYGFDNIYQLNYPTTTLTQDNTSGLIKDFSEIFREVKPETVYLPYKNDVHSDHRIIFDAAYSCTKSFRYPFIKDILMYETISETEFGNSQAFSPNYFVDITEYFDKKKEIFKIYKSEVQTLPMPRSIANLEALATFRGSSCNSRYAESFELLKSIK